MLKSLISPFMFLPIAFLSAGINAKIHAQGCSQPSNLVSTVLNSSTVALNWSASGSAANYTIQYRQGNSGPWTNGGTVTTVNQVLSNLLPETVYTWRVKANCSTYSSIAFFNTGGAPGGNTACSQPSNLDAVITSPTTADLSWSAAEGAQYYTVQYRINNAGAWTTAGSVSSLAISLNNLQVNAEYGWRVKASCSVYSSVAIFNTGSTNSSCSSPSNLEAFPLSTTSVELSWSAIQEAINYTVQYRQGQSGAWITLAPASSTYLMLSGLQENTEYAWQVKANCSDYSSQAVFTTSGSGGGSTSCSAPSNTNTVAITPTTATVEWEANPEATNYTVQYRLQNGGVYTTIGTFTTANTVITGLTPGAEYVWRVKANCSPYGSDVQFSTPFSMPVVGVLQNALRKNGIAELSLAPNPAAGGYVLLKGYRAGAEIAVMNLSGQIVQTRTLNKDNETVSLEGMCPGIYYIQLREIDGSVNAAKLIVTK